ncbi:MAG TPA: TolC family protein, partial [Bryobacteraceae bacterium]|nr:TolC family protein [Bryobacteraceae bacterium]
QPIETGGKRPKRVLVAEKALALAGAELDEHKRQLAFNIKARYIDAVTSRRKAEAIDHIISLNRESYELVNARVQRGDAAPLERQLLLVELRRAEAQRAAITGLAQSAESELRRTIAIDLDGASIPPANALPTPLVTETLDEVRWRALQARPDLRAARTLASQSAAELELVESLARPDITLSAQYTRRYAQFEDPLRTTGSGSPLLLQDRDNLLTLGVSIPLQTRKRNQGNAEAAAARQNAARLRSQHLEATIPIEIDAAWQHYQASRKTLEILNRGVVDESEKNLSVIRQAYDLGQLRLLDVLNEQRRLLETQLSYIDAEADMAMSLAELERAAGGELK